MSEQEKIPDFAVETDDLEEMEILEVVGMDRDSAPPTVEQPASVGEPPEDSFAYGDEAEPGPSSPDAETFEPDAGSASVPLTEEQQLMRLRADYDNLRKRIERERMEFELHANSSLVGRLLPILDSFEHALDAEPESEQESAFREGCLMIYKQMKDELRRQGLRPIRTIGEPFDPQIHDAVATDATSDEPPNTILEEFRRGYLFRNRMMRAAMVKVSTNGADPTRSDDEN